MICENTDYAFPLQADVFHPTVEQDAYGSVKKTWILDRTIACNFSSPGTAMKEDVQPNVNITIKNHLVGRVKTDIRMSSFEGKNSITNVIITNIRDQNGTEIYMETAGIRSGKSTIFEVATQAPFVGPFGTVEYYNLVIRRSENQGATV